MIVLITRQAEADLERIGDYIARDNPRRAISFIGELIANANASPKRHTVFRLCRATNTPVFAAARMEII